MELEAFQLLNAFTQNGDDLIGQGILETDRQLLTQTKLSKGREKKSEKRRETVEDRVRKGKGKRTIGKQL